MRVDCQHTAAAQHGTGTGVQSSASRLVWRCGVWGHATIIYIHGCGRSYYGVQR